MSKSTSLWFALAIFLVIFLLSALWLAVKIVFFLLMISPPLTVLGTIAFWNRRSIRRMWETPSVQRTVTEVVCLLKPLYMKFMGMSGLCAELCYWVDRPTSFTVGTQQMYIQGMHCTRERYTAKNCGINAPYGGQRIAAMQNANKLEVKVYDGRTDVSDKVRIAPLDADGRFVVTMNLTRAGEYTIHVTWNGTAIRQSPFHQHVLPGPAVPSTCRLLGPLKMENERKWCHAAVGSYPPLWLHMADEFGNQLSFSNSANRVSITQTPLLAVLSSCAETDETSSQPAIEIMSSPMLSGPRALQSLFVEESQGSRIRHEIDVPGVYRWQVFFDDYEFGNVIVFQGIHGRDCKVLNAPKKVTAGERISFTVQGRLPGGAHLDVSNFVPKDQMLHSESFQLHYMRSLNELEVKADVEGSPLVADISPLSPDGKFKVTAIVRCSGRCMITVNWNGMPVRGTPLSCTVQPAAIHPPSCAVTGFNGGLEVPVLALQPMHFDIVCYDRFANRITSGGHHGGFSLQLKLLSDTRSDPEWTACRHTVVDLNDGRYEVHFAPPKVGLFSVKLYFQGTEFPHATVCAVDDAMLALAQRYVKDVRLMLKCHINDGQPQKVWLFISDRQISVKKYFLGMFPTVLHSWRVHTHLQLGVKGPEGLVITDERQSVHLTLPAGCIDSPLPALALRTIVASLLYARLSAVSEPGKSVFETKCSYLRKCLDEKAESSRMSLEVKRHRLDDTVSSLLRLGTNDWRRQWRIQFAGEPGIDCGGLRSEFFTLMAQHLFGLHNGTPTRASQSPPLFIPSGRNKLLVPNPAISASDKRWKLCGLFVAKAIHDALVFTPANGTLVPLHFAKSFLKQIVGLPLHFSDFATDDPELFRTKVQFLLNNDIDEMGLGLRFMDEVYGHGNKLLKTADLCTGGRYLNVTDANKKDYLRRLTDFRLGDLTKDQRNAFLEGFYTLIPDDVAGVCDETELQLLISGVTEIDVDDWEAHADSSGANTQLIKWFWALMRSITPAERAQVLQFTTGSSQVPAAGFQALDPKFRIQTSWWSNPQQLPQAATCSHTLMLPRYTSYEQLSDRLLLAVREGMEGFGFA